jgi:hypothetical protein
LPSRYNKHTTINVCMNFIPPKFCRHLIFHTKEAYAKPISLLCYYTNTPILRHKNLGLMNLRKYWETCVFNTETMECLTTATGVNISSKCIPYTQQRSLWLLSFLRLIMSERWSFVTLWCIRGQRKGKCWCYWRLMQVRDISR